MRNIFIVDAQIVDANGTFNKLSGYPKTFDSNNYQGDVDKAKRRAEGEFSECWGAMCKRDDRLLQAVIMYSADGSFIDKKCMGGFPADPESESQSEA